MMINFANVFILFLIGGAALLGVSALVEKRSVRRDDDQPRHPHRTA